MTNTEIYFPERFVKNRAKVNKAIKKFINVDFENDIDSYHELRSFIRQPVPEWHEGAYLPNELLDERDDILARLHKDDFILSKNPSKEELKAYSEHQARLVKTNVWKEWSNWIAKSKKMIKDHPRLEEETETTKALIEFYKYGRNIFSLSPFLIHLLNHTDISNIRYNDIKFPYNTIYLHFGLQVGIEYPIESYEHKHNMEDDPNYKKNRYYLDGAFVSVVRENSLEILLTFKNPNENFDTKVPIVRDFRFPTIRFTLDFSKWDNDKRKFKIEEDVTFNHSIVCFYDIWDSKTETSEIEFEKMHSLTKEPEKCYKSEWEEYVLFDKALMIIVNSLCYLNLVDNDIEISTTNEQATPILKELEKSRKHQQITKLSDKLKKISYSKIHFCGNKIESEYRITNSGIEVEPHWRRGHWRNQPYGIGLSNKKLIWIKPTIVRKDKGEPKTGHIYDV